MKKLLYLLVLTPTLSFAQFAGNFTIKSKVGALNAPAQAYLFYQTPGGAEIDSSVITNGSFEFKGELNEPANAMIVIDRKGIGRQRLSASADMINFYLEKGETTITSADSISKGKIAGSQLNEDNKALLALLNPIDVKAKSIITEIQKAPLAQQQDATYQNGIQAKLKVLQTEREAAIKKFITSHPKSYLSILVLHSMGGPSAEAKDIEPLFNLLDNDVKATGAGQALQRNINELKLTQIGTLAPDFTQPDVEGKPVKLSSFRGKYVLLDFWASWCGPCRMENPNVVKVYNKYKDKNFTVLGVSLDKPTGKADWLAAIKSDGLAWTQVSDLKSWYNEAANLYGVKSIPQNYLIDPQGKIIAKNLRGEDLEKKLAELL